MDVKLEGLDKVLAVLNPDIVTKATAATLNTLGEQLKTQTTKEVRQTYNVKASGLKSKLKTTKATWSNLKWSMEVPSDKRVNLIHFGARKVATGVSVKILKDGDRKVIKGAFIGNKGKTVFKRKGKERLPIKTVTAMSPSQMISVKLRDKKIEEARKKAPEQFKKTFDFYISKI